MSPTTSDMLTFDMNFTRQRFTFLYTTDDRIRTSALPQEARARFGMFLDKSRWEIQGHSYVVQAMEDIGNSGCK